MTVFRHNKISTVKKRASKKKLAVFYGFIALVVTGAIFGGFLLIFRNNGPVPVDGDARSLGVFDPYKTFETDWFAFKASPNWALDETKTIKDKKYIYRQEQKNSPIGVMTIYINAVPESERLYSNVIAVADGATKFATVGKVSKHCKTFLPNKTLMNPQKVSVEEVSFTCRPDGANLEVVVGAVGRSDELQLKRQDGTSFKAHISFVNTAYTPNPQEFNQLLKTFETK